MQCVAPMRILVFDSGIGGLGVAAAIRRLMPDAALTYLMDNAGFPYGGRPDDDLVQRVLAVAGAGIARTQPDLVVVACNTASTMALDALRSAWAIPFVGCVPPLRWAAQVSLTRVIGVLATPATVRGPYLRGLAEHHAAGCEVKLHGAPGLAALAEERFAGLEVSQAAISAELAGLLEQDYQGRIDAVALGCTHYAWLLPELRALMAPHVAWLDPAEPVARQALRVASSLGIGAGISDFNGIALYTGTPPDMERPAWAQAGLVRTWHLG